MRNYPKVSIAIINAYGVKYLRETLDSLVKNTRYPNYEIIVIDCMTPNFGKWFRKIKSIYSDKVLKYVHLDVDVGASAEHNLALKLIDCNSEFIVFLDNDVKIIEPTWLDKLVEIFKETDAAVISPTIVTMDNLETIQHAGGYLLPDFVTNYIFKENVEVKSPYEVFSFSGAAFIIKRNIIYELMKFNLPLYFDFFFICRDDLELSMRLRSRGYKILVTGAVKIAHKGSNNVLRDYHYLKNSIILPLLYVNRVLSLLKVLPYTTYSLLIHELILLRKHRVNVFLNILKACLWLLSNLKKLIIARMKVKRYRKYDDYDLFALMYKLLNQRGITFRDVKSSLVRHYKHAVIYKLRPRKI